MGANNNVISMVHRRAERLMAEIAAPGVVLRPDDDESIDEFIERIGSAIAELMQRDAEGGRN
jgi:hypothetical protein